MILWCSYCQRFLGEIAPYDDPEFSHGICAACEARLARDEPIVSDTERVRALVGQLVDCALRPDLARFDACVAEARALAYDAESLVLALLQPALYQAGRAWEHGSMSVAAEHRLSRWCEHVLAGLPPAPRPPPLELLILQAPGNRHTIGPRIAAHVLAARGVAAEALVTPLTVDDTLAQLRARRPAVVGFSCALPGQVPAVLATVAELRRRLEPQLRCRYLLSGVAFRRGLDLVAPGVEIAVDLSYLAALAA